MNRLVNLLLLVCLVMACKSESTHDAPKGSTNKSERTAPTLTQTTPNTRDPGCDEKALRLQVKAMKESTARYIEPLLELSESQESCEMATKRLLAMEPHLKRFFETGTALSKSMRELPAECSALAKELRDEMMQIMEKKYPNADAIDVNIPKLAARCEKHPGFKEAFNKGVRSMKK